MSHPLLYDPEPGRTSNLVSSFKVQAGEQMTLLFDFAAAASVRETPEGWRLDPQIFTRYVERNPQFATLKGTVQEVDGQPLTAPPLQVLGVFLRTQDGKYVQFSEVDLETGQVDLRNVLAGTYRMSVQYADLGWVRVGDPLVEGQQIRLPAGRNADVTLNVDL
jgi:hypothetical protein